MSDRPRAPVIPAITLWQPWASLIATRSRRASDRLLGRRIAIHAARSPIRLRDFDIDTYSAISLAFNERRWTEMLPLGVVVCTALLVEALPTAVVCQHPFGDYGPGRWAWRLEDVKRIDAPVPARGAQTWGWSWAVPTGLSI
jgi:activating signal cointegrator 1